MPNTADRVSEARQLLLVEQGLTRRYESAVAAEVVRLVVRTHAARFDDALVRLFVPVLVERAARADLDAATARNENNLGGDSQVHLVSVA